MVNWKGGKEWIIDKLNGFNEFYLLIIITCKQGPPSIKSRKIMTK